MGAGEAERPEDVDARAVRDLLERPDRPTAVLCFSDVMAYRVVRTAEELGLRVPEDLSVVGFDDSPLARRMRPALTTVRQDVGGKGRAATAALTAAIEAARTGRTPRPREAGPAAHRARGPGQHRTAGRLSAGAPRRTG